MNIRRMCLLTLILVLTQLAVLARCQEEEEQGDSVVSEEIDDDEEDNSEIEEENGVLLCGHCKQFASEYEKIAKTLKENDPPIPVAKIDATSASTLSSQFDVSGYPTIKILKKGQPVDYDGSRTETEIVAKVKEISQPEWVPPPEATLVLTKENFDETVNEADIILVEFYAPWCGHCKRLAPEYEKAAKELSKRIPPITLAKVDAIAETELAKRFDVSGYPSLKIFRKGKSFNYSGPREKYANSLREDYKFYHAFSSEISNFLKVDPGKLVIMQPEKFQSKYEASVHILDIKESTDVAEVKNHVVKHALPLVGHRKTANDAKRYAKKPLVVVYYMVDFSFDYHVATQYWRNKVLEVAKDFPEYTFAIADEENYSSEIKDLGLIDSGEDVNVAIFDEAGKKYAMEPEEFDSDVLREFVLSFKKGKLKPIVKSQPIPKNNKGPVKIVVGKTFESIVMDPNSDVLIEFYAPWCGHCKNLEPIYMELGKKYKNQKKIIIAKMDATANDVTNDSYKIEGFPTIYFAPSNNKNNPIKFEIGKKDLESLSKFVEEHATKLSRTKDEL
ncbi:Protein disulfide-isomerase A4 [Crotalus adamanteus]|uniref:protein disulfide-isomerase n=1 Tax=Crotalus adamanteus TaxID=8729 RepID=A0AAW1B3V2_CROAD